MTKKNEIRLNLNRVEGDLEIRVALDDGVVSDAWCSGTMFRGIEKYLCRRSALDGLVITPRVCGICGTAHLSAAAKALDMIAGVEPPGDAVRVRNVAQIVESVQSDLRHSFLVFCADFAHPAYNGRPFFEEAVRRFTPFKGTSVADVIRRTRQLVEVLAIIGGQWPHSSYMVPGGIASVPSASGLLNCRMLVAGFNEWYQRRVLGCSFDRWRDVSSLMDLHAWYDESPSHRHSDLGLFIQCALDTGLDKIGQAHDNFISFGALDIPLGSQVIGAGEGAQLIGAGFSRRTQVEPFDQSLISEHIRYAWFEGYEGGRHPSKGVTEPCACGNENGKYSWAKAPRYKDLPAETGLLAEMIMAHNPLFCDVVEQQGASAFVRQLARIVRPAVLLPAAEIWLTEVVGEHFYAPPGDIRDGQGYGLTQAARGALGHWVTLEKGMIRRYQMITPTAWHASPRDAAGVRGSTEEALTGTPVWDPHNPLELGHVVRSFDHCLVCTVHTLTNRGASSMLRMDP